MYDDKTRIEAKRLWLLGGKTDPEIAQALGVNRPDTIRDWRTKENWDAEKAMIEAVVADKVKTQRRSRRKEANDRQLRIAEGLSGLIGRAMNNPAIKSADIKALAGATAIVQGIQQVAFSIDDQPDVSGDGAPRAVTWVLRRTPEEDEVLRKYREGELIESKPRAAAPSPRPGPAPAPIPAMNPKVAPGGSTIRSDQPQSPPASTPRIAR